MISWKMFETATENFTAKACEIKVLASKNEELISEIEALKHSQSSYSGAVKGMGTVASKGELP